jgi:Phage portal protein
MKDPRSLVPSSFNKRLTQAVTYGLTGGWFSPQLPLQPQHQEVAGRRLDYLAGYNISTQPRRDTGISFEMLRNFSKSYDLLRILIEKRKDQIANFEWSVVPMDEAVKAQGNMKELSERAAAAQKFLNFPDGRQKWNTWLRPIIEDMLVLDAIALWPTYKGNALQKLDIIDPSTIKLVIDESGRTPVPPFPAYQQVLHGVPVADFLQDELMYFISNPGSERIYGLSKVEMIVITIQIGLRREVSQLQFFTDGNIPAALAGVPETWTAKQIAEMQVAFDTMLLGDTAARRRLMFVPDATSKNIYQFKSEEATLKAAFDEWLMRIMCFTFGISVTPFVNQVNRATAFTSQEEARDEGLGPQLTFIKGLMDTVIAKGLRLDGIEFKWSMEAENDPTSQAEIDDKMLRNGSRSIDELRQRDGLEPLGVGPMIYLGTGPILVSDIVEGNVPSVGSQEAADMKPTPPTPGPNDAGDKKPLPKPGDSKKVGVKATPDGKDPTTGTSDTDKELAIKTEVSARSASPFRQALQKAGYSAHAFHNPKGAAAQARLVKASKSSGRAGIKKRVETY